MPPAMTGPGGRIPLGMGAGGRDGALRARLLRQHAIQRTQDQKDVSAQHAKELNEATKNALESALQLPLGLKLRELDTMQVMSPEENCDLPKAIDRAQSAQLQVDNVHMMARLGSEERASPEAVAGSKKLRTSWVQE
jgi:hypothetical protein